MGLRCAGALCGRRASRRRFLSARGPESTCQEVSDYGPLRSKVDSESLVNCFAAKTIFKADSLTCPASGSPAASGFGRSPGPGFAFCLAPSSSSRSSSRPRSGSSSGAGSTAGSGSATGRSAWNFARSSDSVAFFVLSGCAASGCAASGCAGSGCVASGFAASGCRRRGAPWALATDFDAGASRAAAAAARRRLGGDCGGRLFWRTSRASARARRSSRTCSRSASTILRGPIAPGTRRQSATPAMQKPPPENDLQWEPLRPRRRPRSDSLSARAANDPVSCRMCAARCACCPEGGSAA